MNLGPQSIDEIDEELLKAQLDELALPDARESAIRNVILIGRLLEIEDRKLYQLVITFDKAFKASTTINQLRDAKSDPDGRGIDVEKIQEQFLLSNIVVQDAVKAKFKMAFNNAISNGNKFNLFADFLSVELFEKKMHEAEKQVFAYAELLSQIDLISKVALQKILSVAGQKELDVAIQKRITEIAGQEEKIVLLEEFIAHLVELNKPDLIEYFKLPLTINQLFEKIQNKVHLLDIEEKVQKLILNDLKKEIEIIPAILREENFTAEEVGEDNAEVFARYQQCLRYVNELNSADSIGLKALVVTAEKNQDELNKLSSRISRVIRLAGGYMPDVVEEILGLLKTYSKWEEEGSYETQNASLAYQYDIWAKYEEEAKQKAKQQNTLEEVENCLKAHPFVQIEKPAEFVLKPLPVLAKPQQQDPVLERPQQALVLEKPKQDEASVSKRHKLSLLTMLVGGTGVIVSSLLLAGIIPAVGPLSLMKGILDIYAGLEGIKAAGFFLATVFGMGTMVSAMTETVVRITNRRTNREVPSVAPSVEKNQEKSISSSEAVIDTSNPVSYTPMRDARQGSSNESSSTLPAVSQDPRQGTDYRL